MISRIKHHLVPDGRRTAREERKSNLKCDPGAQRTGVMAIRIIIALERNDGQSDALNFLLTARRQLCEAAGMPTGSLDFSRSTELVEEVVAHGRVTRERKGTKLCSFLRVHSLSTQYIYYVLRPKVIPVK